MHIVGSKLDPILAAADKAYQLVVRLGLSPSEAEKALRMAALVAEERNTLSARNAHASGKALESITRLQEKFGDDWGSHIFDPEE